MKIVHQHQSNPTDQQQPPTPRPPSPRATALHLPTFSNSKTQTAVTNMMKQDLTFRMKRRLKTAVKFTHIEEDWNLVNR